MRNLDSKVEGERVKANYFAANFYYIPCEQPWNAVRYVWIHISTTYGLSFQWNADERT